MPINLHTNYGLNFLPFRLRQEADTTRTYFGGPPKRGVVPPIVQSATKHLCTLALVDDLDVSLFSTFDHESLDSDFSFFRGTYKMHDESNALVQFVVHPIEVRRNDDSSLTHYLSALGFAFGGSGDDPPCRSVQDLGLTRIYSDHKIGGLPFFNQIE